MGKYYLFKVWGMSLTVLTVSFVAVGMLLLISPPDGECQTPIMPIIPGAPWGCTTIITTTPEGGTRTCLVCTQPGGPTTVSCS